jgi:hypothetical protein
MYDDLMMILYTLFVDQSNFKSWVDVKKVILKNYVLLHRNTKFLVSIFHPETTCLSLGKKTNLQQSNHRTINNMLYLYNKNDLFTLGQLNADEKKGN